MEDANIEKAVQGLVASKYRNAGQTCVCTNRVYVQESIADEFSTAFVEAVAELKIGDGLEDGTDIGPLIDQKAVEKVKQHTRDAIEKGGTLACGGDAPAGSLFMEPTVITGASDDMLCMKEETFGPLGPIATFKTAEEAIGRANNTPYGLAAYVYTENLSQALTHSEELDYGIIGLNDALPSVAQAPFGGTKQSGLGREGGHFGIEEYLEVKYVSIGL